MKIFKIALISSVLVSIASASSICDENQKIANEYLEKTQKSFDTQDYKEGCSNMKVVKKAINTYLNEKCQEGHEQAKEIERIFGEMTKEANNVLDICEKQGF